jgi:transcriptional regulator with XRE-family HTH domain
MSLSISDARVFSAALKKARQKRKLTQAECAELLDHSVSFQKDLERGRCSPSIEGFYHICRTLDISADDCIFQDGADRTGSTYQMLLLPLCDEKSLSTLVAAAAVLTDTDQNAMLKEQSESIRDEQT